jgi:predicted  nucleic acid-binding Zn-ribbon protein
MKYIICIVALFALASCNNSEQQQRLKAIVAQDSAMAAQSQKKDSAITSYITALNQIQDNLDSIKSKEHVVSLKTAGGEPLGSNTVAEIRSLDKLIIKNNREIYHLESRLKKSDSKNASLEKMVAHLTKELAEKDAEIASLQAKLADANNSLVVLTHQFNDSVAVINRQRAEINAMRTEVNTVYYTVGTMKELKNKGLIDKKGGLLGIGRTAQLNPDVNTSGFTKANMTELHSLPLNGKFKMVITDHPEGSYKITGTGTADSLLITDAESFWSKGKYLIISIK